MPHDYQQCNGNARCRHVVHWKYAKSSFRSHILHLSLHSSHNPHVPIVCGSRLMDFLNWIKRERDGTLNLITLEYIFNYYVPLTLHESFASSPGFTITFSEMDSIVAPSVNATVQHLVKWEKGQSQFIKIHSFRS